MKQSGFLFLGKPREMRISKRFAKIETLLFFMASWLMALT